MCVIPHPFNGRNFLQLRQSIASVDLLDLSCELCLGRTQAGGLRRAYMGHLIWIANYVVDFEKQGKNSSKIRRLVQELPDDLRQQWLDFVDTQLAQANRNNEIIPVKVTTALRTLRK